MPQVLRCSLERLGSSSNQKGMLGEEVGQEQRTSRGLGRKYLQWMIFGTYVVVHRMTSLLAELAPKRD